jgi:hypothetical protein
MGDEGSFFAAFDKAPEFFETLPDFLNVELQCEPMASETQTERVLLRKLITIVGTNVSCIQFHTSKIMTAGGGLSGASLLTRSISGENGDTHCRSV